jgi:hypothetical protein
MGGGYIDRAATAAGDAVAIVDEDPSCDAIERLVVARVDEVTQPGMPAAAVVRMDGVLMLPLRNPGQVDQLLEGVGLRAPAPQAVPIEGFVVAAAEEDRVDVMEGQETAIAVLTVKRLTSARLPKP